MDSQPLPPAETGSAPQPPPEPSAPLPADAPAPRFAIGQRVWGPILRLSETQAIIGLSEHGVEEGVLELIHLRDEFGNLSVSEGDEVQAYVVDNGPTPALAPTLLPPAHEVMHRLDEAREAGRPVRGRVVAINRGGLEVDVEGRRAFCPYSQIEIGRCENPEIHLNHILDFMVTELDAGKRRIVLSRRAVLERERQEKMGDLRGRIREGAEFDGVVMRLQPFGAFVDIGGLEGLVHISEIAHERIADPQDALRVGEKVRVRVLGVAQDKTGRDRVRLSIKATLEDPWVKVPEQFHEGDVIHGQVVRVTEFGAFVKLYPGVEGLLHVSQYRPRRPAAPAADAEAGTDPSPALEEREPQVGQEIFVRIGRIDVPRKRISLVLRDEERAERRRGEHDAVVGEVVEGVVRTIKPYGVFVDLPSLGPWVSGLLPGAETGLAREVVMARHFKIGERLPVEIIEVDEQGRIRLSQRTIREREEKASAPAAAGEDLAARAAPPGGFNLMAEAFKRAENGGRKAER
ncbi:MAG: S1 RNA-binding domain-containing protein [Candidatus Eisenbacteria bacterium]|uniref:S1 RNA-binding domain-containing protein n=1 Tax=Eiseniibacteriota bacterium TaxID=2212470 RepID=A0A937X7P3_UNCEI|nr:S1 RNA-binding domain-containing protein [Candidatus Eisenbacteria bacterium]